MCTQSQLNEILTKTVEEAKKIFASAFHGAILYGSFARGDYDDESDIDVLLLVDLPAEQLACYREQMDHLCGQILFEYGIVLSIVEKDIATYEKYREALPFYRNIEREGRRIA